MNPQRMALDAGAAETAAALRGWLVRGHGRVLLGWAAGSVGIGVVLLLLALAVAETVTPTGAGFTPIAADPQAGWGDLGFLVARNAAVIALHALVCLATYLARRSVPLQARRARGINRWVHDRAGPLAVAAVGACTLYSLGLQAWVLGHDLAEAAVTAGHPPAGLLARLSLHAIPELTAVFLPLAACLALARRRAFDGLAAAALLSAGAALPVIVLAAACEVHLTRVLL